MNIPAPSQSLQFAVVQASGLSKVHIRTPRYYASVRIDSGETYRTKTVKSKQPEWKESFDLVARGPSMIVVVHIFQVMNETENMIGSASIDVSQCFQPGFQNIERCYDLSDASNRNVATLKVSFIARIGRSTEAVALDAQLPTTVSQAVVLPVIMTASPGLGIPVLESFVQRTAASSHLSTPSGIQMPGTLVDDVSDITASDSFSAVMNVLTRFVQIGDAIAEVHPYVKLAWSVLTSAQKVLKAQQDRDRKVQQLWVKILDTLDFMKQAEAAEIAKRIQGVEKTVQAIMKQIYDCVLFLRSYGERGFTGRTLQHGFTAKTDDSIQQFVNAFADLKTRFRERIDIDTWKVACNMGDGIIQLVTKAYRLTNIAENKDLENLPGAKLRGIQWDPDHACLPGTRTQLLEDIISWVHDPDSERILWLSGAAGTGKSSIANSIAEWFDSIGRLGASFRFNRQTITNETPGQLFGNLCHQLAFYDGQLRNTILSAIHQTSIDGMSSRLQARKLLVDTTKSSKIIGPVVIIIDALDECGDDDSKTEPNRGTLVRAIVQELPMLPSSIKVLVTSRDEGSISHLFPHCEQCLAWTMYDVQGTEEDILKYVQHRMRLIYQSCGPQLDNWPGAVNETKLSQYADGLFIWADIACTYIENGDPAIQLSRLLKSSGGSSIAGSRMEDLIDFVLHRSLQKATGVDEWHYVVDSIATLKTPLILKEMDSLLGLSDELTNQALTLVDGHQIELTTSKYIITSLRPILRINHDVTDAIQLLHKSVYDFLISRAPETIRVHLPASNGVLAAQCLDHMNHHLHYDLCGIGSASVLNSDVPDLSDRIKHIPGALQYACQYFAHHLNDMSHPLAALTDKLHHFITEHLLHWIEVMSLLGTLYKAEFCLELLAGYLKRDMSSPLNMVELIKEAILLLRNNGNAITHSALHTYASAIPLSPRTTEIYKIYYPKLLPRYTIISSHPFWRHSLRTLEGHSNCVTAISFSPDGKKLASASWDKTLRLWDVKTGTAIGSALKGHSSLVEAVVFSPDGRKLASASYDNTVQLWDVETATAIGSALEGHTKSVTSVVFSSDGKKLASASRDNTVRWWNVETATAIGSALEVVHGKSVFLTIFSPDGKKLASASDDQTVWLWNIETGTAIKSILKGHCGTITSMAFSPDGRKLASSSDDKIWLWDVKTGTAIGSPFEGHSSTVNSVVFSPDGRKLASASLDNIVQLWDVETATAIGSALEGHDDYVTAVIFSPDGSKIAAYDTTIQLWDVETGTAIGPALKGHSGGINDIVFSPDGKKLASASNDKTVQLWDVETTTAIESALERHNHMISSMVFSPDGTKLATASFDKTVRLWDVNTGTAIGSAFEGHSDWVNSVVFSPDGRKLASASNDSTVRLWNVKTGTAIGSALEGLNQDFTLVIFSPDGRKLASESGDDTVWLWDVETGTAIGSALEGCGNLLAPSIVFSPLGKKLASIFKDHTVQLWDTETGAAIGPALEGHSNYITSLVFSQDGRKLASASYDRTVRLWDVETGTAIRSLEGHNNVVNSVTFSPDGRILASASHDQTVRLWDVETATAIGSTLEGHIGSVDSVIFSSDGKKLASVSYEQTVQLWDVEAHSVITPQRNLDFQSIQIPSIIPTIDELGFLRDHSYLPTLDPPSRPILLWIPSQFRGITIVIKDSTIVIGGAGGAVTFVKMSNENIMKVF
ncbi:WD40 repeat-like protein [Ramaria rubella]|nr:WD40 repeat-like protein [Ramaria rubella]